MDYTTDKEIVAELGARLRALRIGRGLTVAEVATRAGLHPNTILLAETGGNPRLETIVRILRVLGRLDALQAFIPPVTISPLDAVKRGARPRQRASRKA